VKRKWFGFAENAIMETLMVGINVSIVAKEK